MHELSVCQSLLRAAEKTAAEHGARGIVTVTVAVGPLSGVEAPLLARAFTVARMGTMAEGAELEIEAMPVRVWCEACEIETETAANALLCGGCGSWQVGLKSGDELLLKSLELAPADNLAKAG